MERRGCTWKRVCLGPCIFMCFIFYNVSCLFHHIALLWKGIKLWVCPLHPRLPFNDLLWTGSQTTWIQPIGSFVLSESTTHRLVLSPYTGIAEAGIPRLGVVEPTSLARYLWKFVLKRPPTCPKQHLAWWTEPKTCIPWLCPGCHSFTSMLMSKSYHIKEVPELSSLVEDKVESYKKATKVVLFKKLKT